MGKSSASLRKMAKKTHAAMRRAQIDTGATTMVVTGSSGLSMAIAIKMLTEFEEEYHIMYVRKEAENNHGAHVEVLTRSSIQWREEPLLYIFMDDLISSGETKERVEEEMKKLTKENAELVAVVLYNRSDKNKMKIITNKEVPGYHFEGY